VSGLDQATDEGELTFDPDDIITNIEQIGINLDLA
jgi:hypothetical protein